MRKLSAIDIELEADEKPRSASERSFGLVFAGAFCLFGAWPLLRGHDPRLWSLLLAGSFLLFALVVPWLLRPMNLLWSRIGGTLHVIVPPVVMGAVFFLAVTPLAMIIKLWGKDPLHLKSESSSASHWIERDPPGPHPRTLTLQF